MAHVILIPIGSAGDVFPFLGLGKCLQGRGHQVTVITSPSFESLIRQLQLGFAPLGTIEDFETVVADPDLWHPQRGFEKVARWGMLDTMRPTFDLVSQHYRRGETVVATQVTCLGARIAHDKLGVPLATVHLQPAVLRSIHQSSVLPVLQLGDRVPRALKRFQYYLTDALIGDPTLAPETNRLRAELGLSPVRRILDTWWNSPQRVIGLFPDWFAPPQPDWPPQTVLTGFPLWDQADVTEISPAVETFLSSGTKPLVFTPGSAMKHGKEFFAAAAEACRILECRGVFLTRYADQLPDALPAGVQHFDFVPFSRILPRCGAMVHHGGIGSTAQSLAAGIPQLIMPMAHDQFDNAARIGRLGAGASIARKKFKGPAVAAALRKLLRCERVARCCRDYKQRMQEVQPLSDAAAEIEQLIGTDECR